MGKHWKVKEILKSATAELLGIYSRLAGVRLVTPDYRPVRYVQMTAAYPNGATLPDRDNLDKITLDAMKRCRLLVDDSGAWLECPRPIVQHGSAPETFITVRDIRLGEPIRPEDEPFVKRKLAAFKRKGKRRGA